ncbi:MAG TPA: hypothetical protein VE173_00500, partial [Longimicrobiales bacterium]|nr:hypothetical protein [Longimicrobiales bacterium]
MPALPALTALASLSLAAAVPLPAQEAAHPQGWVGGPGSADYPLAARWAPYKLEELVHGTSVSPRWIEGSEKFWYSFETSGGTAYWIVDPERGTKRQIFDNDRIAAELTRITRDPWDGKHLPIRSIRFIDDNTLQFEVESSRDEEAQEEAGQEEQEEQEEQQQEEQRGQRRPRTRKKIFHFEYTVDTRALRELEDYEEPDSHPSW